MLQGKYHVLQETISQSEQPGNQNYAYLLVNSLSGSRLGKDILQSKLSELQFQSCGQKMFFFIHDLSDQKERSKAFKNAQGNIQQGHKVFVLICGGDGTVQWVINESVKSGINLSKIIFSPIPIGTGNDFANSVGWGNFRFQVSSKKFQELAKELLSGKIGDFDIWESSVDCFDSGQIIQMKNGIQVELNEKMIRKNFTNYFGVGTDAQISFIAQKLKAKTVFFKKIAYGFAGIISFMTFCGSLKKKISEMFSTGLLQQSLQITESSFSQDPNNNNEDKLAEKSISIGKNDCCFTFLNSTCSMQLQKIWETPYYAQKNNEFKQQSVNDGLIEIVSYRNEISLMFERAFHMAKKVGQGKGPFVVKFKEPTESEKHSVFVHVNGEPYKINNIKQIKILPSTSFPQSKIKVLYRSK